MPRSLHLLFLTFFTATLVAPSARAQYRVFILTITNTKTQQTRLVKSTLDNIQYPGYYPLDADETISLTDTWMCWGTHGESVPLCANPKADLLPTTSSKSQVAPQASSH